MGRDLDLPSLLNRAVAAVGLEAVVGGREALEAGLRQVTARLAQVGAEAQLATDREEQLAEAARNFVRYPALAEFHGMVEGVLFMALPSSLLAWVARLHAMPELPLQNELRTALVHAAAKDPNHVRRALCRMVLIEGVYVNLVLAARQCPVSTYEIGPDPLSLLNLAEREVAELLELPPLFDDDVRPFEVLVASGLKALEIHGARLRDALATVSRDCQDAIAAQARLEAWLATLDATDALLIRNMGAEAFSASRLSVERLQERYPLLLGDRTRAAIDQQVHRLRGRLERGEVAALERKSPALIDLLESDGKRKET